MAGIFWGVVLTGFAAFIGWAMISDPMKDKTEDITMSDLVSRLVFMGFIGLGALVIRWILGIFLNPTNSTILLVVALLICAASITISIIYAKRQYPEIKRIKELQDAADKGDAEAAFEIANMYLTANKINEARKRLEKCLNINPDEPKLQGGFVRVTIEQCKGYLDRESTYQANELLTKLCEQSLEQITELVCAKCRRLVFDGANFCSHCGDAVSTASYALELEQSILRLGKLYFENDEPTEAIVWLEKALGKNPENKEALDLLIRSMLVFARTHNSNKEFDKATEWVEKALAKNPNHKETIKVQGEIAVAKEKHLEAIRELQVLLNSAESGDTSAMFKLVQKSLTYEYIARYGVEGNEAEGDKWVKIFVDSFGATSAEKAALELAENNKYFTAYGFILLECAYRGNVDAQYRAAILFDEGKGVWSGGGSYDAFKWYQKAAENGHPSAQVDLAHCYLHNTGIWYDMDKACHWGQQAIQNNRSTEDHVLKAKQIVRVASSVPRLHYDCGRLDIPNKFGYTVMRTLVDAALDSHNRHILWNQAKDANGLCSQCRLAILDKITNS